MRNVYNDVFIFNTVVLAFKTHYSKKKVEKVNFQ